MYSLSLQNCIIAWANAIFRSTFFHLAVVLLEKHLKILPMEQVLRYLCCCVTFGLAWVVWTIIFAAGMVSQRVFLTVRFDFNTSL